MLLDILCLENELLRLLFLTQRTKRSYYAHEFNFYAQQLSHRFPKLSDKHLC
jgi:hypothetical protein